MGVETKSTNPSLCMCHEEPIYCTPQRLQVIQAVLLVPQADSVSGQAKRMELFYNLTINYVLTDFYVLTVQYIIQ